MSDAKHTPGPWYVREATAGGTFVGSDKWSSVLDYGIHNEERQANARLIAAAPDLLAEARGTIGVLEDAADAIENAHPIVAARLRGRATMLHGVCAKATGTP